MRRDPSRRPPGHLFHVRGRFLQTRRRFHLCCHHRQQESVGLRLFEVPHAVDFVRWIHSAHHDQHVSDHALVSVWDCVLVEGKDLSQLVT